MAVIAPKWKDLKEGSCKEIFIAGIAEGLTEFRMQATTKVKEEVRSN
jgi:hypothetical protein